MRATRVLALGCLLVAGCSRRPAPAPAPEAPVFAAPRTLEEVMRRTELAFWPKESVFEARQPTYLARVGDDGLQFSAGAGSDPPLRFGRPRLSRGAWTDETAPLAWRRLDDGSLWRAGPGFAERLENTDQGLEQSWRFGFAPPGEGSLMVRVPVSGAARVQASAEGLHFAQGHGFVRYGHGTWIDADGVRTAVPVRLEGDAATLEVPPEVLARSPFPAVLDPLISAEQDVDTPTLFSAYSTQTHVSAASNGKVTLATWLDYRRSPAEVYATRVDQTGQALDGFGIPLGLVVQSGTDAPAAVASDGTNFLVVLGAGPRGLLGVRVTPDGVVLDQPAIQISNVYSNAAALAWTGAGYVALSVDSIFDPWNGLAADNLVAMTVSPSGALTSRANVTNRSPSSSAPRVTAPLLAWSGSVLLACYRDGGPVFARRILPDLTLLDVTPIAVFSSVPEARVAWDGQRFLVTAVSSGLVGTRITTAGVVLDQPPFRIMSGSVSTHGSASDDAGVALTWLESRSGAVGLYAAHVTPAGSVIDLATTALAESPASPNGSQLVHTPPGHLALWRAFASGSADIFAARLDPRLTVSDGGVARISSSAARQDLAALSWNGSSYLAAWVDNRMQQVSLFTTRLARDGTPLSPLATAGLMAVPGLGRHAVATNGADWLLTWQQSGNSVDIAGAVVSSDGTWTTDAGVPVVSRTGDQSEPDVAWVGDRYVVVFREGASASADIHAVPVLADGTVLADAGFIVSDAPGEQSAPRIAASDGGALVVWSDRRDAGSLHVFGARLTGGAQVIDTLGLRISDHNRAKALPAVAAGEAGYLVCWGDYRSITYQPFAARVSTSLGLLDDAGIRLSTRPNGNQVACAAAWDGELYYVGWTTLASSLPSTDPEYGQVRGTWVGLDGLILDGGLADGGDWVWAAGPLRAGYRSVALGSPGHRQVLLGYTVDASADGGGVSRVRTRTLTRGVAPLADGGFATTPEEVPVTVPLSASDGDGDPVTFVLVRGPANGQAVVEDGGVRYEPARDFFGEERFTVAADDGALRSAPVEVVVTVTPVDDAPFAPSLAVSTDEDQPVDVLVPDRDADDAGLTLLVRQPPSHGTLSGAPPMLRYTPTADFWGTDAFDYALTDGVTASPDARVEVTVRPVPDAPVAADTNVSLEEDTAGDLVLVASDADGDALAFEVTEGPLHGTLEGVAPRLRYTPERDYVGDDRLVFRASDGTGGAPATVRITVTPVNDAPVATSESLSARGGEPLSFTLHAQDVDDATLSFGVVAGPSSGELSGDAPTLVYTPAASFAGEDTLTFEVVDAAGAASLGTIRFEVLPAPERPASCGCTGGGGTLGLCWLLLGTLRRRRPYGPRQLPPSQGHPPQDASQPPQWSGSVDRSTQ